MANHSLTHKHTLTHTNTHSHTHTQNTHARTRANKTIVLYTTDLTEGSSW